MTTFALWTTVLLGTFNASPAASAPAPALEITLAHGSATEARTRTQLLALVAKYPVRQWIYTRRIVIEDKVIPHSDPVLTLSTRHLASDLQLLSTFLHEEMHWFVSQHQADLDATVAELRRTYPTLPVGYPDGANDEEGSYEHLVVNNLEWKALARVVGAADALATLRFWQRDHYRTLYRIVEKDEAQITALMRRHQLLPAGL
jgi:hypothetical protein